jgi:hypothetical protein
VIKPICTHCGQFKDEHSYKLLRCPLPGPGHQWHPETFYNAADVPTAPAGWTRASGFKAWGRNKVRYKHKRTRVVVEFHASVFVRNQNPQKFLEDYLQKFLTPQT